MNAVELALTQPDWKEVLPGLYYWSPPWQPVPSSVLKGDTDEQQLKRLPGHWAIVDVRGTSVSIAVDRQRSRQILAGKTRGGWFVTDQLDELHGLHPFVENSRATSLFRHFGHTVGAETMIEGVWDCPAASIMTLTDRPRWSPYVIYRPTESPIEDQRQYSEMFREAVRSVFDRLTEQTVGRQLVVPISAGLDSRLILTALRDAGAENVATYSYGTSWSPQAPTSAAVAKSLDYPYHFVEYEVDKVSAAWSEENSPLYARFAWGGTSLPFRQDWYAVRELTRLGIVEEGAVVLPGHTVPASMARRDLFQALPGDLQLVGEAVARATGSYQGDPREVLSHASFQEALVEAASEINYGAHPRDNMTLWQWMTLKERQAKFITNSVRVYEHFGLAWAMPLHEPEIWDARRRASATLTLNRSGYRSFVENFYADVSGIEVPNAAPSVETMRFEPKLGSAFSALWGRAGGRLQRWVNQARPPRSPFALEAFRPQRSLLQTLVDSRSGKKGNGLTIDRFLAEARGESLALFDQPSGA